jgi:hypothetical protein
MSLKILSSANGGQLDFRHALQPIPHSWNQSSGKQQQRVRSGSMPDEGSANPPKD